MRLLILTAALLMAPAAGATATLSTGSQEDPVELLVGFLDGAADDTRELIESLGASVVRTNDALRVHVVSTRAAGQFAATAALSPLVEYVEENDAIRANGAQWNGAEWNGAEWNGAEWNSNGNAGDPGLAEQWGLAAIRAPDAWNVSRGERDATLCILDSGVAWDHPDLAANAWTGPYGARGFNAIDPRASAYDDAGHGTHMAGIAAAVGANGVGVAGVGNVTIIPVKVLSSDGTGREDDLAVGLAWCADRGADVALLALSVDDEGPTVRNAIAYAAHRDVLLVASAGNRGPCTECVAYPARDAKVLAVSAVGRELRPAGFSSQGAQVDLTAPGVDVVSTFVSARYASGSGTSQAAAFAAGAAALLRDVNPDWTAKQARAALERHARDVGDPGRDARTGAGLVDVAAALGGT